MITTLIGSILLTLRFLYVTYNEYYSDWFDYLMSILYGCVFGGVLGFIVACTLPMDLENRTHYLKIESLQDNQSVSGKFFLGSGRVNNEMKYMFYYEINGMYRFMQVNCNKAVIKYTDGTPRIEIIEKYPTDKFINTIAFDFNCFSKTYVIEVPKGTIKSNYNLDAM